MGHVITIVAVGPQAADFLAENMAITFAGDVPDSLRPHCYVIEAGRMDGDLAVGQGVRIGEQHWRITAIGKVARQNLADLGHVTLVFDGADTPRLPGALHVGGVDEPPALALGATVVFGD